jgi:hypothetical protein
MFGACGLSRMPMLPKLVKLLVILKHDDEHVIESRYAVLLTPIVFLSPRNGDSHRESESDCTAEQNLSHRTTFLVVRAISARSCGT